MNRALQIYREYPRTFWMMILVNFVDRLGGSILFPFFALYITKKFDVAKYFTRLDYAQGLYIHLMNKSWFDKLPADLQKLLIETIEEESTQARAATQKQQQEQIAEATARGVEFLTLAPADRRKLVDLSAPVYEKWGPKVGVDYLQKVRSQLGN